MGADPRPSPVVELPLECEEFLTWLATSKGRSHNTLVAYRRDLLLYVSWLADRRRAPLDATVDDLVGFVDELRRSGRAPASVARTTVAVRSLHRFLADEELRDDDPSADIEVPRVPRGLPKALTEEEIARLIDQVEGDGPIARRDRAILEVPVLLRGEAIGALARRLGRPAREIYAALERGRAVAEAATR